MDLYTFSSTNLTNIWAGIGAGIWAISSPQGKNVGGAITKSAKMPIGATGFFYCVETKTFTTPFLVYSVPQQGITINDVWSDPWILPFRIHPLGTPRKQMSVNQAQTVLPILAQNNQRWDHVFHIQGTTVFVPTMISTEDWQVLLEYLADK